MTDRLQTDQPLVSIIMPAYNAADTIGTAIESVLEQTYSNWELLIVNDGSRDTTEQKILFFTDPRIRYFTQANAGVSAARNVALDAMEGDYFCFLDSDDAMTSDSIASRLKVFHEHPKARFVDGAILIMNDSLTEVLETRHQSKFKRPFDQLMKLNPKCFFGLSWMIQRCSQIKYQFKLGMTHCEDLLFFMTIADQGEYHSTRRPILKYRKSANSAMSNLPALERGYWQLICEAKHLCKNPKLIHMLRWHVFRIMGWTYLKSGNLPGVFRTIGYLVRR